MNELIDYKCPACGGKLEFDSSLQKMKCPFCDSVFEMEEFTEKDTVLEEKQDWSEPKQQWSEGETDGMSVFACNFCGGEIIGDSTTGATSCPYCGSPVVMKERFQGGLKPDYVIPFKLDKAAAKAKYLEHIKGKFLLPKQFADENHIDEIKGVYVPFWLFDSEIDASASFVGENIRHWSDSKFNYTETSYYDVFRSGKMKFHGIPIDGSSKMDDDLMESIEPFDLSEAVPFQSAYLSGYFADRYDVNDKESQPRANERIRQSAISLLKGSVNEGYSAIKEINESVIETSALFNPENNSDEYSGASVNVGKGMIKYALYPVWLLTTTYKDEKYTFAMNGQTGKFVGNLPVDNAKKNGLFWGIFAGVSALATAAAYLLLG